MIPLFSFQVKLVKCLVQNIVVDISFNQSGGLSTLCFLEQVCWLETALATMWNLFIFPPSNSIVIHQLLIHQLPVIPLGRPSDWKRSSL